MHLNFLRMVHRRPSLCLFLRPHQSTTAWSSVWLTGYIGKWTEEFGKVGRGCQEVQGQCEGGRKRGWEKTLQATCFSQASQTAGCGFRAFHTAWQCDNELSRHEASNCSLEGYKSGRECPSYFICSGVLLQTNTVLVVWSCLRQFESCGRPYLSFSRHAKSISWQSCAHSAFCPHKQSWV